MRNRKTEKIVESNIKTKGKSSIRKVNIFWIIIILAIVLVIIGYKYLSKSSKTYTVVNGYIESMTETVGYIFKDETIIPFDNAETVIPVIAQSNRVSKDEAIAIYQNNKYSEYKTKIDNMDKQIADAIKDLPAIYSNDILAINTQIQSIVEESQNNNSYIKMQEFKNKLDELAFKKIMIIGNLSPAGSNVKDLINQRNQYETDSKKNADNIKSSTGGIVSYKLDKLESVANINNITSYSIKDLSSIFEKYSGENSSVFGIKVINNYLAYIVVKEPKGINDSYIAENKKYDLAILDSKNTVISATLTKKLEDDSNYYCIFKITNGIENLVDSRYEDIKVLWNSTYGMAVPLKDLIDKGDIKYVNAIKYGEYIEIPVKIVISSDNMCIVRNYTTEEKQNLGIQSDYTLNLYDQIIT